jgi:hypothetical protein
VGMIDLGESFHRICNTINTNRSERGVFLSNLVKILAG